MSQDLPGANCRSVRILKRASNRIIIHNFESSIAENQRSISHYGTV